MFPKNESLKELMEIPGVGIRVAHDLYALGIRKIVDLKKEHPEILYERLCSESGVRVDRCMLYVMRCAVYYAKTPANKRDTSLLLWWNWKDTKKV
jgi:serine kinase of HPr protein (carbohydrate metabolism regulator)